MKRTACVVMAILASGKLAAAQENREEQPAYLQKSATISLSPIHLALPMLEAEAEFKLTPELGAGVILGGGRVSDPNNSITATAYEAGAQLNYYFLRPFSGLHVGVEGLYLSLGDVMQDSSVTAAGFSVGPYVGYKVQTDVGFAFIAQAGAAYMAAKAESSTSSAMASDKRVYPLINLNVGWSF